MTASAIASTARHADLTDLVSVLRDQQGRKLDIVAPASTLHAEHGQLVIAGTEPILTPTGVSTSDGLYQPTAVFEQGIAAKLGINAPYLRKCRAEALPLWDANVNGWLERANPGQAYLVRCLRGTGRSRSGAEPTSGIARALLSDSYKTIDHLDVLTAALDGIDRAGVPIQIQGCDLTDSHMYVRIYSPAVRVMAPALLHDYVSPFSGARGADNPTVWGGFVIRNSEVGAGAATITPRLVVEICNNGYTITADAHRSVHLGKRLAEGTVDWSAQTSAANLELITSETRDAVARFLDPAYVHRVVADIQAKAGFRIEEPEKTIKSVSTRLRFTEDQQNAVFAHFIQGADLTAGGVMHAVTATAQTLPDADAAHDMESRALQALHLAAARP
ncbi:hypothetical protein [Actinomadura atramentaria]|uniref:hypothetical protein n=1 Tax=Actinomadura atramentaria TaxID=1990 RepID=UPI000364ED26|nr:hypothetical protein [Actinomadura atramentaria]